MNKKVQKEVHFLKVHAIVITLILGVMIFSGFKQNSQRPKIEEIDVEDINIVEKDGHLKMVISNKERVPGPIIGGKTLSRQGGNSPGMIFYTEKGDECGGLKLSERWMKARKKKTLFRKIRAIGESHDQEELRAFDVQVAG